MSLSTHADSSKIKALYSSYLKDKSDFFKAEHSKQNIAKLVDKYLNDSRATLEKIKKIEQENKKIVLSEEGNQIALDVEVIEPIKLVANSSFSKDSCSEAKVLNELNHDEKDTQYKVISGIIEKICR